jgi:hypothetical protein
MPSDYTISAVTLAAPNAVALLFTGRPARRTLIVAASATSLTFVGVSEGDFTNHIFARIPAGNTLVMPLRDFGPLITGEIWVSSGAGAVTINGAEVYDIPKGGR